MQHKTVVCYWSVETTYRSHLRGSSSPRSLLDCHKNGKNQTLKKVHIFFVRLWELTQYTSMVLYPHCLNSQDSLKKPFQNLTLTCPTHPAGTLPHLEGTSLSAHHLHCTQCLAHHYGCDLLLKMRYRMSWHNKYHCVIQSHMSVCSQLIWWIGDEDWLNLLHTKA